MFPGHPSRWQKELDISKSKRQKYYEYAEKQQQEVTHGGVFASVTGQMAHHGLSQL
jgi:hypothetical protein